MYIGKTSGYVSKTSSSAPNEHVEMLGASGGGKTSRINQMELEEAKDGSTVIVVDINQSHADEMIYPPIWGEFQQRINRIDAKWDGLNIEFLRPMQGNAERMEDFVTLVNSATHALSSCQRMGSRQIGVLREAIIFALNYRLKFPDEMTAIGFGLLQQDDPTAKGVYQKLWTVFNSGVFRMSPKCIKAGAINVISFVGMDKVSQATLVEILLFSLWRTIRYQQQFLGNRIVLTLDEFQNLALGEGSVLRDILREGRKFGISLLLATQIAKCFPKDTLAILDQVGTKLYFRPAISEIKGIAKVIAPDDAEKWSSILSRLRVGEAVAVGNLMVGGVEINHPVLTR